MNNLYTCEQSAQRAKEYGAENIKLQWDVRIILTPHCSLAVKQMRATTVRSWSRSSVTHATVWGMSVCVCVTEPADFSHDMLCELSSHGQLGGYVTCTVILLSTSRHTRCTFAGQQHDCVSFTFISSLQTLKKKKEKKHTHTHTKCCGNPSGVCLCCTWQHVT